MAQPLQQWTDEDDAPVRRYARWLHPELGEDAYHTAVCEVLVRGRAESIRNAQAFYRVAIRRALYKIFRHEQAEREQTARFLAGDPPSTAAGLAMGRHTQTHCRRRHELSEENCCYIGKRRTCRTCKREREARAARVRYAALTREERAARRVPKP